jgi:hypothetical protein
VHRLQKGSGGDFTQRRDVGTTTLTCVCAARADKRLKEGRGLPGGARGQWVGVGMRNVQAKEHRQVGPGGRERERAREGRVGWHQQAGPIGQREGRSRCNTQFVNNRKRVYLIMCFCPIFIVTW